MHDDLHCFLSRLAGTVIGSLIPVVFVAFVSMPVSLGHHPGEPAPAGQPPRHMT